MRGCVIGGGGGGERPRPGLFTPEMNLDIFLAVRRNVCEVEKEKRLTAPNATDSMVCMRASSMVLSTPFLLSSARPASVQKRTCLIPTDTKWVSESGRNSATKILWVWPCRVATLAPVETCAVRAEFPLQCDGCPEGNLGLSVLHSWQASDVTTDHTLIMSRDSILFTYIYITSDVWGF